MKALKRNPSKDTRHIGLPIRAPPGSSRQTKQLLFLVWSGHHLMSSPQTSQYVVCFSRAMSRDQDLTVPTSWIPPLDYPQPLQRAYATSHDGTRRCRPGKGPGGWTTLRTRHCGLFASPGSATAWSWSSGQQRGKRIRLLPNSQLQASPGTPPLNPINESMFPIPRCPVTQRSNINLDTSHNRSSASQYMRSPAPVPRLTAHVFVSLVQ